MYRDEFIILVERLYVQYIVICYAVVWQHVIGMVCVLLAVLRASVLLTVHRDKSA